MGAEPIHATPSPIEQRQVGVVEVVHPGPYAQVPSEVLLDSLEHQYNEGVELDMLMVGELGGRLLAAERELAERRLNG